MISPISFKEALGLIAIVIAVAGYIPYFRDLFSGKTKPHAFSWLIWGLLTAIAFAGQIAGHAGAGSWVMGFTAFTTFVIFSLFYGEKNITRSDWLCLILALSAIPLWIATRHPVASMILVTVIDALGFWPTFRKSYSKPNEETAFTYFLSGAKFFLSLVALDRYSIVTWLYPVSLVIMNWGFVLMALIRRHKLLSKKD
jgi:hypothetical protein